MDNFTIKASWLRRLMFACAIAGAFMLAGCQSVPKGGLTEEQVKVLKEQGFSETDAGWTLDQSTSVLFAFNETTLAVEGERNIARLSKVLLAVNIQRLKVVGYTDSMGDEAYNEELSKRRADVVLGVFVDNGYSRADLQAIGMGSRHPIADNRTKEGRAMNRHVAIIVVVE